MNEPSVKSNFLSKYGLDLLVAAALILILYIMIEQTIRVYLFGANAFSYTKMSSMRSTLTSGNSQHSDIDGLDFELKPDVDTMNKFVGFKTNSRGLRDNEYTVQKPDDTFRVAVVGGSYTMGTAIEFEDTFHSVLEKRLNRESEHLSYEFINFGVGGYKLSHKLAVLAYKVPMYDPDLVLLILDGSKFLTFKNTKSVLNYDRYSFFRSYSYMLLKTSSLLGYGNKEARGFIKRHTTLQRVLDKKMRKVNKIAKKNGFPVCVVVLDHDYEHLELSRTIGSFVSDAGLCFINTVPVFKGTEFIDYAVSRIDKHPNARANRVFADVIYDDLMGNPLLGRGGSLQERGEIE